MLAAFFLALIACLHTSPLSLRPHYLRPYPHLFRLWRCIKPTLCSQARPCVLSPTRTADLVLLLDGPRSCPHVLRDFLVDK